jgi:hypothetical protein
MFTASIWPARPLGGAAVTPMPEKKITLADAFRVVLRAAWPQRPDVADEIRSYPGYFHIAPIDPATGKRHPEAQAAFDAEANLMTAIVGQRVRAVGRLGSSLMADIDATEITTPGINVFEGTIEIYDRGITLRTYRNVHCYENEIRALSKDVSTSRRVGRRPGADWDAVAEALRLEVQRRGMFGPDNDADWRLQADVERWVSSILEDRNEAAAESTVRDRVSKMLQSIEAGN